MVAGSSTPDASPLSGTNTGQSSPPRTTSTAKRRPARPSMDVMLVADPPARSLFGGLMDRASYDAFAADLTAALEARPEVLGLVAAGSFASGPDEWSDHDFLVIAAPDTTAALRADTSWLPHHERLVLHFPETVHGMKGVYDD